MGSLSHGDGFAMVLVSFLTAPRARPIRKLDLCDAGLTDVGITAIATLIGCTTTLRELNISRNYISPLSRSVLYRALLVSRNVV